MFNLTQSQFPLFKINDLFQREEKPDWTSAKYLISPPNGKNISSIVQGRHGEGSFKVAIAEEEGSRRRDGEQQYIVLQSKQMI